MAALDDVLGNAWEGEARFAGHGSLSVCWSVSNFTSLEY